MRDTVVDLVGQNLLYRELVADSGLTNVTPVVRALFPLGSERADPSPRVEDSVCFLVVRPMKLALQEVPADAAGALFPTGKRHVVPCRRAN